jgi:hypothetical protein
MSFEVALAWALDDARRRQRRIYVWKVHQDAPAWISPDPPPPHVGGWSEIFPNGERIDEIRPVD